MEDGKILVVEDQDAMRESLVIAFRMRDIRSRVLQAEKRQLKD